MTTLQSSLVRARGVTGLTIPESGRVASAGSTLVFDDDAIRSRANLARHLIERSAFALRRVLGTPGGPQLVYMLIPHASVRFVAIGASSGFAWGWSGVSASATTIDASLRDDQWADPAETPFIGPYGRPLDHTAAAALLSRHFEVLPEEDYGFDLPEDLR
jgi:hypothetical protein